MAQRSRNATATRAEILAAARTRFGADGYDRTTLRAIAADVGVDPAMVIRYFKNKESLFAAAAEFTLHLPDLTGVDPHDLAGIVFPQFFAVWEEDGTFLALLRSAATSPTAAARMREIFTTQVAPALTRITPDHPAERAGMMGAFVIGLATSRYILRTPGLASMSHADLVHWAGPVIRQILTGPVEPGSTSD